VGQYLVSFGNGWVTVRKEEIEDQERTFRQPNGGIQDPSMLFGGLFDGISILPPRPMGLGMGQQMDQWKISASTLPLDAKSRWLIRLRLGGSAAQENRAGVRLRAGIVRD
jgi:hypothetical protein